MDFNLGSIYFLLLLLPIRKTALNPREFENVQNLKQQKSKSEKF